MDGREESPGRPYTLSSTSDYSTEPSGSAATGVNVPGLGFNRDHAKQTVGVVIWTGGEEKLIVLAGGPVVAELKCPNLGDDDRLAVSIAQSAEESARGGIEGVDTAVRNIVGDQQSIAERAEIARGHRHSPRRMQWA